MSSADVAGLDGGVDRRDLAGLVDVERPAVGDHVRSLNTPYAFAVACVGSASIGKSASFLSTTVRLLAAAADQFHLGCLRERGVVVDVVDARHEVDDVVLLDLVAVLRERLALDGAALRERFGEPGHDHVGLAAVLRELVGLAIGALQTEVGRHVADLHHGRHRGWPCGSARAWGASRSTLTWSTLRCRGLSHHCSNRQDRSEHGQFQYRHQRTS